MRSLLSLCLFLGAFAPLSRGVTLFAVMTTNAVDTSGCTVPAEVHSFLPTDTQVYLYFGVQDAAVGDVAKVEYWYPDGTLLRTAAWSPVTAVGSYCYTSSNSIAGSPMASALGIYTAQVYWNDIRIASVRFSIQEPGLTTEQKLFDFQALASLYAKRYAHTDWKKTLFSVDPLDLTPWVDAVRASRDDTEYLAILVKYVASFNDSHASYSVPTDFYAYLGFRADAYFDEGRQSYSVLIDSISRAVLPLDRYPFETGDEVLSVDGVKVADLIEQLGKYLSSGNVQAKTREAASYIPLRYQSTFPQAHLLGGTASVEIRRQSGAVSTYDIPWRKYYSPLTRIGPSPMPKLNATVPRAAEAGQEPPYMRTLARFQNERVRIPGEILGLGSLTPVWNRPDDFVQRLGSSLADYYYSGTMTSRGLRLGYLRIPDFSPDGSSAALRQLNTEIEFFEQNTDGLVVDVMRNPGGNPCYGEEILRRLIPTNWRAMGRRLRVTWEDIADFEYDLYLSRYYGADQATIDLLDARLNNLRQAYDANTLTEPVSLCASGMDRTPAAVAYTKPILLLTDEFSASAAESFAAQFQDNNRGKIYGWRTNGAGGTVRDHTVGFYSEGGTASVTVAQQWRPEPIETSDFPKSNLVENVGVRPNILADYMSPENFRQNGKLFVDGFLDAIAAEIEKTR